MFITFCVVCVAPLLAVTAPAMDGRFLGTWKLNSMKSKLEGSGLAPNAKARLEPDGSGFKATVEAITPDGRSVSYTYQLTLDGKPVKVTGAVQYMTKSSQPV